MTAINELANTFGVSTQTIRLKGVAKLVTTNGEIDGTRVNALKTYRTSNPRAWPTATELSTFATKTTTNGTKTATKTTEYSAMTTADALTLVVSLLETAIFSTVGETTVAETVTFPTKTITAIATVLRNATKTIDSTKSYQN